MARLPSKATSSALTPEKGSSVSIRAIENGYITSKTERVGKGGDYRTTEVFTPSNPIKTTKK